MHMAQGGYALCSNILFCVQFPRFLKKVNEKIIRAVKLLTPI